MGPRNNFFAGVRYLPYKNTGDDTVPAYGLMYLDGDEDNTVAFGNEVCFFPRRIDDDAELDAAEMIVINSALAVAPGNTGLCTVDLPHPILLDSSWQGQALPSSTLGINISKENGGTLPIATQGGYGAIPGDYADVAIWGNGGTFNTKAGSDGRYNWAFPLQLWHNQSQQPAPISKSAGTISTSGTTSVQTLTSLQALKKGKYEIHFFTWLSIDKPGTTVQVILTTDSTNFPPGGQSPSQWQSGRGTGDYQTSGPYGGGGVTVITPPVENVAISGFFDLDANDSIKVQYLCSQSCSLVFHDVALWARVTGRVGGQ